MAKNEKNQGSYTKSEVVTLRLDPKKRFGLELLARKQYRSTSAVIEWMLDEILSNGSYISNFDSIWDVDESDRLVKLAFSDQNLLTYDEQKIWKTIRECGYFWRGRYGSDGYWKWNVLPEDVIFERVREKYSIVLGVSNGEYQKDALPTPSKKIEPHKPAPTNFDLDDEIPF